MRNGRISYFKGPATVFLVAAAFFGCLFSYTDVQALTLNVIDGNGNPIVGGFRWLLEEDNTNQSPPGVRVNNSIGVDIHKSHAPLVSKGNAAGDYVIINSDINGSPLDPAKKYYVSVIPDSGYTMSGAMVAPGQAAVTVRVHSLPIPTAQISVLVFEDHNTINNVYDPGERGLEGFTILVSDLAGPVSQDAFGNPLGTEYDAGGNPIPGSGNGVIMTCTAAEVAGGLRGCTTVGEVVIKNLPPGKYGVRAVPPAGSNWIQTSTIEGTLTVDAWVKANEPRKFFEGFGTGFYHVFLGFVDPGGLPWAISPPGGSGTIQGRNVFNHFSRPPTLQGFFPGPPVDGCWIGLNDLVTRRGLIAVPCDGNSNFTIAGVPPGTYQLVTWDKNLDALFGFNLVTVPAGGGIVNLGNVLSYRWFGTLMGSVFYDANQNGFREPTETGMPDQVLNIRFRDGSMYQTTTTDMMGEYAFTEVFPFFKWLVAEVDFARYKATGMTTAVDYGGAIPAASGWTVPSFGMLNPQPQVRVNPNTGNNLSRTEKGPVLTQAMHLFLNQTNVIDWGKAEYSGGQNGGITGIVYYSTTRAENDPRYGVAEPWEPGIPRVQVNLYRDADGDGLIDDINGTTGIQLADVDNFPLDNFPGPEDIDRNGNGIFDLGDAIDVTHTDSWDDNTPTGCIQNLPVINGQPVKECFDNFGTWNQVRPGVFDGGYAFPTNTVLSLPQGTYVVEVVPPPGYEIVKEEDKNVDFGEDYIPQLLPPACVGEDHVVPLELTLFPGVPGAFAGQTRPLCDKKQVFVTQNRNAAADFFLFTEVPKAARAVGFVNNDLAAEFDKNSPIYGEKSAPAWIPISIQDWTGHEVARVYADEWGSYNAMIPSTYTMNVPAPSGVSPNMLTLVLNHPIRPDGSIDPFYDPNYATSPWTFQFMPATTSYLDTPNVPLAAFIGYPKGQVDMEPADKTPVISKVSGPEGGPLVCNTGGSLTISSSGSVQVPNPDYDPSVPGSTALIMRDYGFGATQGSVKVGNTSLAITGWSNTAISATVPAGTPTGQLVVTRGDNNRPSEIGVTVHVVDCAAVTRHHVSPGQSIQAAIDAASPGDIILVNPGTYHENVILYKNVVLQGSGAGASMGDPNATIIFANPSPADRLAAWHNKVSLIRGNDPFIANEAPGIMVFGDIAGSGFSLTPATTPRIDGFQIFGAIQGGGIYLYNQAHHTVISNNRIRGNQGSYGGGITVGLPDAGTGAFSNSNVTVQFNRISGNGGVFGAGGVELAAGSDNYIVRNNIIVGNLSRWNGGGIAHYGLSDNGLIAKNKITFNEVFFGVAIGGEGGGIFISGEIANGNLPGALGDGAGNVTINGNLIQGNLAGAGSGGGIRALWFNGADVPDPMTDYSLNILNNMIVNNVAGYAGGAIALQDVAAANIINNTVAYNDSTATAANAFAPGSLSSTPRGAGIVSNAHSAELAAATGQTFSNPLLANNIIWRNRSFYNNNTLNGGAGGLAPNPASPYWDLEVSGTAGAMNPVYCLLTNTTGYGPTNISGDPQFILGYTNSLASSTVLDEGGNAITVRYTPLRENAGNYHILGTSPAVDRGVNTYIGSFPLLAGDYDGEVRPSPGTGISDMGADEISKTTALLTIQKTGTGTGTVTSSDGIINCGAGCFANYPLGAVVTLNAVASSGSAFGGWSGACTGSNPTCQVTMNADKTATAMFNTIACTYSINPTSQNFGSGGGTGNVNVTTTAGCNWTAVSNAGWITVTGGASGTGNGVVTYSVAPNAGAARTGTITIAGRTFTVSQAGAGTACTYSISPTSQVFRSGGGTGSVSVTTTTGCQWTANSNAGWIKLTGASSGTGSGTVTYSVSANTTGVMRTGTVTIAGKTFTVTQY